MTTLLILVLDSYRMLRAQKMFWLVLGLTSLVALIYASLGFNERGASLFFGLWTLEDEMLRAGEEKSKELYLLLFTNTIMPFWLGLVAVVVALVSTASIFPEFVRKGSVDLALSKPPPRLLLFLGKYLGSLLFVFLQVFPFTVIVFLSFGLRFGDWNFTLFWAVPLIVSVFSLVYATHVLISVWSGSTVFGLLAACIVWGVAVLTEWTEFWIYQFAYKIPQSGMKLDPQSNAGWQRVEPKEDGGPAWVTVHRFVNTARTVLPKTRSTSNQMKELIKVGDEPDQLAGKGVLATLLGTENDAEVTEEMLEAERRQDLRHSVWADLASSLVYEVVIVGFAAFIFCRRDY